MSFPQGSFRQVFNNGVRHEAKHHLEYRKRRQSLAEDNLVNPFVVEADGSLTEKAFHHRDINRIGSELSRLCPLRKSRRLYANAPLWWTYGRVVSLYWPILNAMETIPGAEASKFWEELPKRNPDLAFLPRETWETLLPYLENTTRKYPTLPRSASPLRWVKNVWHRFQLRWALRKTLGSRLRYLLVQGLIDPELIKALEGASIRTLGLECDPLK